MYFHAREDMIGRTVEIDGEPDDANAGDVGTVIEVDASHVTVEFADGTRRKFRDGEVAFY